MGGSTRTTAASKVSRGLCCLLEDLLHSVLTVPTVASPFRRSNRDLPHTRQRAEDINDIKQALIKLAGRFERYHVSGDDAARARTRALIPPFWLRDSLFMELEKITLERCGGLELSLVRGPPVFSRSRTVDRSVWAKVAACINEVYEFEQILPAGPGLRKLCAVERLRFPSKVARHLGHATDGIDDSWLRRDNERISFLHRTETLGEKSTPGII